MWRDAVTRAFACALVMLLLRNTFVHCCGPGRGGARRRSTRKLMPLIFKEHVPNVYENTLGASGLTEGPITRDSARFQELVPNYNPDIIFRDEEGTGADRLMTERCKERLDTLAISVMNQWPGVRLRVKEGWEDDVTQHNPDSLHFEGRALDIATSDSDRSKYGMLGRLAVEAGFDWVYYEARSHVHCSCKSEAPALNRLGGCFPGSSIVRTPRGPQSVASIRPGDLVQVMGPSGTPVFSPVLMMIHSNQKSRANFLRIHTKTGRKLNITPSHLLMIIKKDDNPNQRPLNQTRDMVQSIFAGQIRMGDQLVVQEDAESFLLDEIVGLTSAELDGVFAPLTNEGSVIVDDTVVSCYANIDSQSLAHWSFLPVRIYYKIKNVIVSALENIGLLSTKSSDEPQLLNENNNQITKHGLLSTNFPDENATFHAINYRNKNSTITTVPTVNVHSRIDRLNNGSGIAKNQQSDILNPSPVYSLANSESPHNRTKTKPREVLLNPDVADTSIHWYARCLYAVARLVLPKTWIVS